MMATTLVVAIIVFSCRDKLGEAEKLDLEKTPVQVVDSMFAVQSTNGVMQMRMEAPKMERFDTDSTTYESFPDGLSVYAYTSEGLLETTIFSDNAMHIKYKSSDKETWEAFGNVVIQNVIKQQTMETDTLYWDRANQEIYTDCYVRMYSADGFSQGFGMRSDERASNAILNRPFNNFMVVVHDSTAVVVDSVNFIGPFPKK
jgi:LPS export ABC transporter protein LptC